jgi:hypothetical protein
LSIAATVVSNPENATHPCLFVAFLRQSEL